MTKEEIIIGTPVIYWRVIKKNELHDPVKTEIISEAWELGQGSYVRKVKGISGGVSIDHLNLITAGSLLAAQLQGLKEISNDDIKEATEKFFSDKGVKVEVKLNPGIVLMPEHIKIYNGCHEPCDALIGPCCCGATHNIDCWKDKIPNVEKYLVTDLAFSKSRINYGYQKAFTRSWKDVKENPPKESGRYWCNVKQMNDLGESTFQWNCCYDAKENSWTDNLESMNVTHYTEFLPNPF